MADILLVGFIPNRQHYPLLASLAEQIQGNVDLAALMQQGSASRLQAGVLTATFSVVFYLIATFAVYRLQHSGRIARYCFLLLFTGYTLSPLGHAGFYYLGISAQTLLAGTAEDNMLHIAQYNRFYQMLLIHWLASVTCSALGWLLLIWQILRQRSVLPRRFLWLTPLPLALIIAFTCKIFPTSSLAAMLGGASLNLAQLIFYSATYLYCLRNKQP